MLSRFVNTFLLSFKYFSLVMGYLQIKQLFKNLKLLQVNWFVKVNEV